MTNAAGLEPSRQTTAFACGGYGRRTAEGRQRQYAAFGCSRWAGIRCRSVIATRERPLSPSLTFSAAW